VATVHPHVSVGQGKHVSSKNYRYLQLGLRDKLLESLNLGSAIIAATVIPTVHEAPEPAETMMATRRWLMTQYDWTGIASRFYTSPKTEVGAFSALGYSSYAFPPLPRAGR